MGALVSSLLGALPICDYGRGLALNLGTELAGALVTYLLLELVVGRMERREAEREAEKKECEAKKADLIAQMGSQVPDEAIRAIEELRRYGWLYDGSLQGANLVRANLPEVDLVGADLQRAILDEANLQGATLSAASLQGAALRGADLQWARLLRANLQEANLFDANLQRAVLFEANAQEAALGGANLQWAILIAVNLQEAYLDEDTILPDGTKWTPDTDMARFTDPKHPDFWRPDA